MKRLSKTKVLNIMMACILFFSIIIPCTIPSYASNFSNIMHKIGNAIANTPINYNFALSRNSDLQFVVKTNERTGVTIIVKEAQYNTPTATITLAATNPNWQYQSQSGIYQNNADIKLAAGEYILELRTDEDVTYDLSMNQKSANAKLDKNKLIITKGFTDSIVVKNGKIQSCTSSNKDVAQVDNKGKITAKSTGKTTIKVKLKNKKVLSCKVTVVANKYSAKKITVDNATYNSENMKVYQAAFDKNGNLNVKFQIVNNSAGRIINIKNMKVVAKNKKIYVSYTINDYKVSVNSFTDKAYSVTIPKSKLKVSNKKIDLRTSKISITGNMITDTM